MESLANFQDGLKLAFADLEKQNVLRGREKEVWQKAISLDARVKLNDQPAVALRRCQLKVRRLYAASQGRALLFFPSIDWTAIVQWIKDHWQDILRVLLTVVPFII